jgi:hypothetical protein
VGKKKRDKLEKRKRARESETCGNSPKSHKRRGPSPSPPPDKPTPRAEYSTVGLAARIKA